MNGAGIAKLGESFAPVRPGQRVASSPGHGRSPGSPSSDRTARRSSRAASAPVIASATSPSRPATASGSSPALNPAPSIRSTGRPRSEIT